MSDYETVGEGVTRIDAKYVKPGVACFYLLESAGEYAVIETGTSHSVPQLLDLLEARNVAPEQLRYVIPTHVHLDHAGGAGSMMRHFANATLMTNGMMLIAVNAAGAEMPPPLMKRVTNAWSHLEAALGEADYFGGSNFTTADIMLGFSLTTARAFNDMSVDHMPNLKAWLKRIGAREAYQRGIAKAEPGFPPKLD